MSNVKIVLNSQGIQRMLKSPEVQALISEKVNNVAQRAGDGFVGDVRIGRRRTVGRVHATSLKAHKKNMKNNILLKALGG